MSKSKEGKKVWFDMKHNIGTLDRIMKNKNCQDCYFVKHLACPECDYYKNRKR